MKSFNRIFTKHLSALLAVIVLLGVGLACSDTSDAEWQSALGGKKLTRAKTSGSLSDKITIWFCPSGEFGMKTESTGFSTGGGGTLSMASEDFEYGRWTVRSSVLVLEAQNGNVYEYDISKGSDETVVVLNGNGYLVERHNECR